MTDVEESIKVRLDQETANRLQNEHPEQFVTLVRMHLSFELDLNTDAENDSTGLDKQKVKKWKGFHKKAKGCTSMKALSPEATKTTLTKANIDDLKQLITFLEKEENISQEGIFRKTGSLTRQNELKSLLVQGNLLSLDQGGYTAHDCASVLKSSLADLSEPLLTELYYPAYCQVGDFFHSKDSQVGRGEDRLLNALQLLLLLLPEENNTLLRYIIELLNRTIQYEATNKMSAENLATLFTPHLICPRKLAPEALHTTASQMSGIVGFMIKTGLRLFHIPAKLATDIRAYFVEQRRRKTMSPEHILNESTTSDSVANTVYSFVDREKTAEAHIMNSTDTALAQLYAHIQSLPESSKKKKLVSKFNRQNGYGTPLQVLMLREKNGAGSSPGSTGGPGSAGGMKYPRSISDSIKRHIFHKSLMSRTPKRSGGQTPVMFQTPNRAAGYSGPKQRVLFQSPVSSTGSPASTASPACLQRCSSVSSSSSTLSSLSLTSTATATPQSAQKSIGSGGNASSASESQQEKRRDDERRQSVHKRRSSGEADRPGTTSPLVLRSSLSPSGGGSESGSERKRSRVEADRLLRDEPIRPKSAPMVRFGSNGGDLLDDGEPPPPVDDEDFVDQEDDDIGDEEDDYADADRHHQRVPRPRPEDDDEFSNDELRLLVGVGTGCQEEDDDDDCDRLLSDNEDDRYVISPGAGSSLGDTRSRFRSEPNLSAIVYQKHRRGHEAGGHDLLSEETADDGSLREGGAVAASETQTATPGAAGTSSTKHRSNISFFKSKLIKGVSMGNLRFPFGSESKANRKHNRSSEKLNSHASVVKPQTTTRGSKPDEPFADHRIASRLVLLPSVASTPRAIIPSAPAGIGLMLDGSLNGGESVPRGWHCNAEAVDPAAASSWTANYLTSTPGPASLGGRNSMSPITKSTQRMPKSMQESIMTPRSRKPVILLPGMHGNDPQQLSTTCASFSSLKEEDEEADCEPIAGSSGGTPSTSSSSSASTSSSSSSLSSHGDAQLKMLINDTGLPRVGDAVGLPPAIPTHSSGNIGGCGGIGGGGSGPGSAKGKDESGSLTNTFRDYLLSRSVMPQSPADLSFASQSDDFDSTADTLDRLSESKMSESLLYCMNGNEPPKDDETTEPGRGEEVGSAPAYPPPMDNPNGCGSELDETAL